MVDSTGLIDYNFQCFKKAIQEVFDVRKKCNATSNGPQTSGLMNSHEYQNGGIDGSMSSWN